jgi:Flp pilus assembly protein TadG
MSVPACAAPGRRRGGLLAARDGAAAVETALLLPVLFLLLLGVIELGRLAWTRTALTFAVQEAARCASVRPGICGTASQTAAFAARTVAPLNIPASAFTVTTQACGTQVRAQLSYRFVAYAIFRVAPTLTAQVCRV